jgi:hypothetical protein
MNPSMFPWRRTDANSSVHHSKDECVGGEQDSAYCGGECDCVLNARHARVREHARAITSVTATAADGHLQRNSCI